MIHISRHIAGLAFACVLIAAAATPATAQWMLPRAPLFDVMIDGAPHLNAYDYAGNPAYLRSSVHAQAMNLRLASERESGAMAGFLEPGMHNRLQQQASVKRIFGDVHVVQGGFAVEQDRRVDWAWLANRDYEDAGPFFFGDSTAGDSRFNALILEGAYSRDLGEKWSAGVAVAYRVDNGLKKVSPRPTSEHRDVRVTLGVRVRPWSGVSVGAHVRVDDLQEEIRYRTDEGAVMEDTRLLKFRGYDRPQVVNSQVETRFNERTGAFGGLTATLDRERVRAVAHAEYGTDQGDVRDDPLTQRPEGYQAGDRLQVGAAVEAGATEALTVGLRYDLLRRTRWARHPHFDVLLNDYERLDHSLVMGLAYRFTPEFQTGVEFKLAGRTVEESDYYAAVDHELDGLAWELRAGGELRLSSIEISAVGGFGSFTADHDIHTDDMSRFYSAFRRADVEILGQDHRAVRGAFGLGVEPPFPGSIRLDANVAVFNASGGFFEGKRRTNASLSLVYELIVF